MGVPSWLSRILDHYAIPYQVLQHPPAFTASHLAHVAHVSGHRVAKSVFLDANGSPVTVVLPASERLDLESVRAVVGNVTLRLADEQRIASWFRGCQPGGVPPLRLRSDQCIFMDRSLGHLGSILFPAGSPDVSISVRFRDWYRAVQPGLGRFGASNSRHGPPTVLVIDDEADTNDLLCKLMEREGLACQGVGDGVHALEAASKARPSAILLDLMLPDMSGFEVWERLRRSGPLKRVPVVVVTALDDAKTRQRGMDLGADAYLVKPFHPNELLAEMHDALE